MLLREWRKEVVIYREENLPLFVEDEQSNMGYGSLMGAMTVTIDGEEKTLQQAGKLLFNPDRTVREQVRRATMERRYQDAEAFHLLLDKLIALRHQVAMNADFSNYRDFMFAALGRFDYTPEDCMRFHEALAAEMLPGIEQMHGYRREKLGVNTLRPWDLLVDLFDAPALQPFANTQELIAKTIACLQEIHPEFARYLSIMQQAGHLDLDSRKGKAPGGFNTYLAETGIPFIFMNAVGVADNVRTMLHESGHAIHNFLTKPLDNRFFRKTPAEISELASMSMELISMEHWHVFYPNPDDLCRAKIMQLEDVLERSSSAAVNRFQHWLYLHPGHSHSEREAAWLKIAHQFSSSLIDWSGLEQYQAIGWQGIGHIYLSPFYMIEYAIAQLGAIAIWRNYKQDPEKTLQQYINALSMGYTRPIDEVYAAAGIQFDFSQPYVRELTQFVRHELEQLYAEQDEAMAAARN